MKFLENFLKAIQAVFGDDKKISDIKEPEDRKKVADKYNEMFETQFEADFKAYQEQEEKAKAYDTAFQFLASINTEENPEGNEGGEEAQNNEGGEGNGEGTQNNGGEASVKDLITMVNTLVSQNKTLMEQNKKLSKKLEDDEPKTEKMKITLGGGRHTDKYLFGMEHPTFSMENRWNKIMANPAIHAVDPVDEEKVFPEFQKAVSAYGGGIAKRMQHLHKHGLIGAMVIDVEKRNAALDVDYSNLTNAGLGDQFVVRRQDALIAQILSLPSVYDIFPRRYGIQDREVITNAFFGEFSQPYQSGEVWKGSAEIEPEVGHVDDAMFKTLFNSMEWIERTYIGYLNSDGSDATKWTMIEWMILNIAKKLTVEQSKRRIVGIACKPATGVPYHANHTSTGVLFTLVRYMNELKIAHVPGYEDYDGSGTTMIDATEGMLADVKAQREDFNEAEYAMYLNANHRAYYKAGHRTKYAADNDFASINDQTVQDTELKIIWVPNMGNHKFMWIAKPGSIQCLENLPGEMFNIKFQQDMEAVKSWSRWKEGTSADYAGKPKADLAELSADNFQTQEIFVNKPSVDLADGATTANANNGFWFISVANTGTTAITNITNKKAGTAYIIECGNTTNATTVAKSGFFSEITAAYNPTAVGDYLMVYWDPAADSGNGKFYELERRVGGTRTINKATQPNVVGNGGR